ncbi:MAG: hypothetical protein M3477_08525 [Gemmatimonadota bacterium]|nr:hypothetical protein [Gemmatimonadota bacterium]
MTRADFDALKKAVEDLHHCEASYLSTEHVRESFEGNPVWDGGVSIFAVTGHPAANMCYAWSDDAPGSPASDGRNLYAVLQLEPIKSARDAVMASIAVRCRSETQPRLLA